MLKSQHEYQPWTIGCYTFMRTDLINRWIDLFSIIHDQSLVIRASYTESNIVLNTSQHKSTGKQTTHATITRMLEYMHVLL